MSSESELGISVEDSVWVNKCCSSQIFVETHEDFPTLYINQSKFNVSTRKPSLLCRPHKRVPNRSEKRPYAPVLKPYIVVDKAQLQKEHFLT